MEILHSKSNPARDHQFHKIMMESKRSTLMTHHQQIRINNFFLILGSHRQKTATYSITQKIPATHRQWTQINKLFVILGSYKQKEQPHIPLHRVHQRQVTNPTK